MGQVRDITGQKFGRWTVFGISHQVGSRVYWHCQCDCGTKRAVWGADLKRGGSVSCGCHMREKNGSRLATHRLSKHPLYRYWIHMKVRCGNSNDGMHYLYGGRGIKICARWALFENFFQDMEPSWKKGLTLDRIDVNGDYNPKNCKWSTPKEQANNRRNNRVINTLDGPMTVQQAAEMVGINPVTIYARIRYGWDEQRLLGPPRKRRKAKVQ